MATINATLTMASDINDYGLAINKTMTLNKAGTSSGLELTSGLVRRRFTSTNQVDLITSGAQNYGTPLANKAHKVYIKNIGTDTATFVRIGKGTSSGSGTATATTSQATTYWELGHLYGGDWMLIPWDGNGATGDITIQPSVATTMDVEFMVFFQEA